MMLWSLLFWCSVALLWLAYAGYALLLFLMARGRKSDAIDHSSAGYSASVKARSDVAGCR